MRFLIPLLAAVSCTLFADAALPGISGRYPHLAMFNHNGECGTGAVVPWADRLWVITYGPHLPNGSDDKLYEITSDLHRTIRPESVGGTPADRMIHRESNQLIIGPYFIDDKGGVRVIPPKQMPGRLTAAARHLEDPANKVYVFDMEGMLYEVDVHTLAVKKLFARAAPGAHGKGAYTGQGRLVIANNGDEVVNKAKPALDDPDYAHDPEAAGVLAEWDGKNWTTVERRQFTDITSAGGINGAPDDHATLWALGWDKRSVMLKTLDAGEWSTFRLPISDFTYVAKHGWYTEWPRIREVGGGKFLMNMHGGWFDFPKTFSAKNPAGIRPIADYLKITGDFCAWRKGIVFGCDDAALEDTPLAQQSQSNLWFTRWGALKENGRPSGCGAVWLYDAVKAGVPSAPFLFAGYDQRMAHLGNNSAAPVTFTFEMEAKGKWTGGKTITVAPHGYAYTLFPNDDAGEWVRVKTDRDCEMATVSFHYGPGGGSMTNPKLIASIPASGAESHGQIVGKVLPRGADKKTLQFITSDNTAYEIGEDMKLHAMTGPPDAEPKPKEPAKSTRIESDEASLIVVQGKSRFRLPRSVEFDPETRSIRDVVTERSLINAGGSFFQLPWSSAGGAALIKPICTHDKRIADFCSWRGLLVLSGVSAGAKPDGHCFASEDGKAALWFGDIDDLWKFGKPRGKGGPWLNTSVEPRQPSDSYLMFGYDKKSVTLSHDAKEPVVFTLEVDFIGNGNWHEYAKLTVPPAKKFEHTFPSGYSARWVRVSVDHAAKATAVFSYQ